MSQIHPNNISGQLTTLNKKIISTSQSTLKSSQAVGLYGYEPVSGLMNRVESSVNNELKVIVPSGVTINNSLALSRDGASQVLLTGPGGIAVKADSDCVIQPDPELRLGWNCKNDVAGTKFNLYYFNGLQEKMTLFDLQSVYFRGAINVNVGTSSMPFIQVYTKPTGSGDAGLFYHSLITYTFDASTDTIGIGEECLFYAKTIGAPTEPPTSVFTIPRVEMTNRKIALTNKILNGDGFLTEEILYIVVASYSGAPIDEMNVTLNLLGFNTATITRNLSLEAFDPPSGGSTETTLESFRTENASNLGLIDSSIDALDITLSALNAKVVACDTANISGNVAVSSVSGNVAITAVALPLPTGAASETTLSALNAKVVVCDTGNISGNVVESSASAILADTTTIAGSHYVDGQNFAASDTGVMMMGRNNSNVARPMHITANGDLEIEIADFVKGQALMSASFPVVLSSDQSALEVNTLRTATTDVQTNVAIPQSGTFTSNTIDMDGHSKLTIMGSSTNTNDALNIAFSVDDINYYRGSNGVYPDFTTGNYAAVIDVGGARYVQLTQTDTQTTSFTMNFSSSKR